eukprot:1573921-Prymnesium_polylepis.1
MDARRIRTSSQGFTQEIREFATESRIHNGFADSRWGSRIRADSRQISEYLANLPFWFCARRLRAPALLRLPSVLYRFTSSRGQ